MQQLECESNSITCMSCLYVHVYGNKVIYLSIYVAYHMTKLPLSLFCEILDQCFFEKIDRDKK